MARPAPLPATPPHSTTHGQPPATTGYYQRHQRYHTNSNKPPLRTTQAQHLRSYLSPSPRHIEVQSPQQRPTQKDYIPNTLKAQTATPQITHRYTDSPSLKTRQETEAQKAPASTKGYSPKIPISSSYVSSYASIFVSV